MNMSRMEGAASHTGHLGFDNLNVSRGGSSLRRRNQDSVLSFKDENLRLSSSGYNLGSRSQLNAQSVIDSPSTVV